jgi:hypothetical protein
MVALKRRGRMACRHRHDTISSGWAVESCQYRHPIGHRTSPDAGGFVPVANFLSNHPERVMTERAKSATVRPWTHGMV